MTLNCPHCQAPIQTSAEAGAIIQCPACRHLLTVPSPPPPPTPAPGLNLGDRPHPGAWDWGSAMILWDVAMALVTIAAFLGVVGAIAASGLASTAPLILAASASVLIQCGIYWAVRDLRNR